MLQKSKILTNSPKYSQWFLIVAAVFITCLITANIVAVKLINLFGLVLPAAVIIFPISYIVGDVLTEVYGYHHARKVIWLGFTCNLITVGAIWIGRVLPPASFWNDQDAYIKILGNSPRILLASFIAYLAGEFLNSYVLAVIKIRTKGRLLWVRTIGSTIVGQGVDSFLFITIAFFGVIPLFGLASAVLTQWCFKTFYESLVTPFTYFVINGLKEIEQIDYYDHDTNFNPLTLH